MYFTTSTPPIISAPSTPPALAAANVLAARWVSCARWHRRRVAMDGRCLLHARLHKLDTRPDRNVPLSRIYMGAAMKATSRLGLFLFQVITCSSCLTQVLWDNVHPNERVFIPATEITEVELVRKEIDYKKYDKGDFHGYLVKKGVLSKLGDYSLLTLGTPITVSIDGAMVAVVVWGKAGFPH